MRLYAKPFVTVPFVFLLLVNHVAGLVVITKVISKTITTCTTDQPNTLSSASGSGSGVYSTYVYSDTTSSPGESGSSGIYSVSETSASSPSTVIPGSSFSGVLTSEYSVSSIKSSYSVSNYPQSNTTSTYVYHNTSSSLSSPSSKPEQGGYPTSQPGGYPTSGSGGYPTSQPSGYPTSGSGGYPTSQPSGYPTSESGGYPTSSIESSYAVSSYPFSSTSSTYIFYNSTSSSSTLSSTSELGGYPTSGPSAYPTSSVESSYSVSSYPNSNTSSTYHNTTSASSTLSSTSKPVNSTGSSSGTITSTSQPGGSPTSSSLSSGISSSTSSSFSSSVTSSSSSRSSSSATSSSIFSSSTSSTTSASASATPCSYWLEDTKHQGIAAFNSDSSGYQVFRNVKDFGAKGDGVTDDTAAINLAISSGGRCAPGACGSSTTSPALVYFPNGTYLVSSPIIDYYYTQIIGNPNCLPVIKAKSTFSDRWVIDGDQYQPGGALGYGATNVFWRQIRNFIIDMTAIAPSQLVAGIHWPTAQATSLQNILFKMSTASGVQHEGIFVEQGSGGFVADLTFYGGLHGITVGNQQFTMRNLTFHNAVVAISQLWDWGWTYKGISINNCGTGLDITSIDLNNDINEGAQNVASVTFIDSEINNTPIGIATSRNATSTAPSGGSLILENVRLNNVNTAVQGPQGPVLAGSVGPSVITAWGQGHSYTPSGPTVFQGAIDATVRPGSLTAGTDYYERSKPQYDQVPKSQFISARDAGAKGDGVTDDTEAINTLIASAAASETIVFFDAGTYLVTSTIYVPPGSKIVGEAYPVILSSGSFFASITSPKPVIQIGQPGETGSIEWSDTIVSTQGAQAGAILIEYNLSSSPNLPSGIWDVHTRIGGFAGSSLQVSQCPKTPSVTITSSNLAQQCIAAFLSVHITSSSSGLYLENNWFWVADHDVDDSTLTQITIYAGRGLLIESSVGGIQLVGTAVEHHQLYEYQLSSTKDIVLGQIQTETAYYQSNPGASLPFPASAAYNDPVFPSGASSGWGLRIVNSEDITVYGAGLYSFFNNYDVHCSDQGNGETCQERVFSVEASSGVRVFNLNTVGTGNLVTLDGVDVAKFSDNLNGFVDTIALFEV